MKETKFKKLLEILSDGKLHSGEALGKKLAITRAGVWKLMQQMKDLHILIEAKTNRGYCIPGGMELFDLKKILIGKNSEISAEQIKIFDTLDSTNTYLLERVRMGKKDVRVCLAEHQTLGRGRFGRSWVSSYGKNIYCSLLWSFTCDLSQLAGLSLVVAVAVVRALKLLEIGSGLELKWPNDIQYRGKKLAGILIELHGESHHCCDAIIGIGLNGELGKDLRKGVKKAITDIHEMTGKTFARNQFVSFLLKTLVEALTLFQTQGLKPFLHDWQALDVANNQPIKLLFGEKTIEGIYRGVDPSCGELLLEDSKGTIRRYSSGEVSLRF